MLIIQLRARVVGLLLVLAAGVPAAVAGNHPACRTGVLASSLGSRAPDRRGPRGDPRLTPYVAPSYPDDFQVVFANPDSARALSMRSCGCGRSRLTPRQDSSSVFCSTSRAS